MLPRHNSESEDAQRTILDWENRLVLAASQAAAGAITRNMVAVVVHPDDTDDSVKIEFVTFMNPAASDEEAITEFAEDLDTVLEGRIAIQTKVTVDRHWRFDRNGRLVYLARRNPPAPTGSEVLLGTEGGRSVRFHRRTAPHGPDPYEGSSFVIDLVADGISVTQSVFIFGFGWDLLSAYFDDLSSSWRGWEGIKEWSSVEHDLTIQAESDALGRCHLTFRVQNGPTPSWRTSVGGFAISLGEDAEQLAADIRAWTQT